MTQEEAGHKKRATTADLGWSEVTENEGLSKQSFKQKISYSRENRNSLIIEGGV